MSHISCAASARCNGFALSALSGFSIVMAAFRRAFHVLFAIQNVEQKLSPLSLGIMEKNKVAHTISSRANA